MLGTSDGWSMSRLSRRPSEPAYYIEDFCISSNNKEKHRKVLYKILQNRAQGSRKIIQSNLMCIMNGMKNNQVKRFINKDTHRCHYALLWAVFLINSTTVITIQCTQQKLEKGNCTAMLYNTKEVCNKKSSIHCKQNYQLKTFTNKQSAYQLESIFSTIAKFDLAINIHLQIWLYNFLTFYMEKS